MRKNSKHIFSNDKFPFFFIVDKPFNPLEFIICCTSSLARSSASIKDGELMFINFRKGNSDQNSRNPEKNKSHQEMTTSDNIIEWGKYTPRKAKKIQDDGIVLRIQLKSKRRRDKRSIPRWASAKKSAAFETIQSLPSCPSCEHYKWYQ